MKLVYPIDAALITTACLLTVQAAFGSYAMWAFNMTFGWWLIHRSFEVAMGRYHA